jgi:hypothetical protein
MVISAELTLPSKLSLTMYLLAISLKLSRRLRGESMLARRMLFF